MKNLFQQILFLLAALMLTTSAAADETLTPFDHVMATESLPQNTISGVVQDAKGYIWFGVGKELYKYDGYELKKFGYDPEEPTSISDGLISDLCIDDDGYLWIGTREGHVDRLDPSTGKALHYPLPPGQSDADKGFPIEDLCVDRLGRLWVGTSGAGLLYREPIQDRLVNFNAEAVDPFSLSKCSVLQILEDSGGELWLSVKGIGLVIVDRENGYLKAPGAGGDLIFEVPDRRDAHFIEDQNHTFWIWTWGDGLYTLDRASGQFSPAPFKLAGAEFITSIIEDRAEHLWIGTRDSGLYRIQHDTLSTLHYRHQPAQHDSLSSDSISCLFEDRSETLWIGTGSSLDKQSRFAYKLGGSFSFINPEGKDVSSQVVSLYVDSDSRLWIGVLQGGVFTYDLNENQLQTFKIGNFGYEAGYDAFSFLETSNGEFLIGTAAHGLYRVDRDSGAAVRISREQHVADILEDSAGRLWIATNENGLGLRMPDGEFDYWEFRVDSEDEAGELINITTLIEDRHQNLWIGSDGGLYKLEVDGMKFKHISREPGNRNSLSDDRVLCIHENSQGILWIGTRGGLNRYEPLTEKFRRYLVKDILPDNVICGILPDSDGYLWLSTSKGLARFDPRTEECQAFDYHDGLSGYPFAVGAWDSTDDGCLLFGGRNGFCCLSPQKLEFNQYEPGVVITSFQKFEREVIFPTDVDEIEEIRLTYDENFFSFEFAALDFADPDRNSYAYMLEGLDKEWNRSGNRRFANYTKVPPGNYVFRVRGSNNDGVWNSRGASVRVIVVPPFWMTSEFRALLVALLVAGTFATYSLRTRSIKRQRDRLQQEVDERIEVERKLRANQVRLRALASELTLAEERERHRISVALHDRIGHALLLTKVGLMAHAKGDLNAMERQPLDHLIDIMNTAMKEARSLTVEISPPSLHKLGLESALESLVEKVGTENGLKTVVSWDSRSPISKDVAVILYQAVRELLVNIIKHAKAETVSLSISNNGEEIQVRLQDNGKGFDVAKFEEAEDDFTGFGLFSIRERMESIGGRLMVRSKLNAGTKMTLIAPLKINEEENGL